MQCKRPICLLMVDDSDDDRELVRLALDKMGVAHHLWAVADGELAIEYLSGRGVFSDRARYPFPDVLLVDVKMPRLGGFDLLRWLSKHPEDAVIPTIVFSSSGLAEDVDLAYELGANAYLKKPNNWSELLHVVQQAYQFWSLCELPKRTCGARELEPVQRESKAGEGVSKAA